MSRYVRYAHRRQNCPRTVCASARVLQLHCMSEARHYGACATRRERFRAEQTGRMLRSIPSMNPIPTVESDAYLDLYNLLQYRSKILQYGSINREKYCTSKWNSCRLPRLAGASTLSPANSSVRRARRCCRWEAHDQNLLVL